MIRLTLRQLRTEAALVCALLALLAIVLVITGIHLEQVGHAFETTCHATATCGTAADPVLALDQGLQTMVPGLALVAPLLLGLFVAAPLIGRELETGTFRLAWTQSVTRGRWLAVKLGLVGLGSVAASALLTWLLDWWQGPLDTANRNRFDPLVFSFHGVVPVGYAAFAFALGLAAGVLLRRTVAAIALTLLGFVVARIAVTSWLRPRLAAPLHGSLSFLAAHPTLEVQAPGNAFGLAPPAVNIPDAWIYSTAVVDRAGYTPTPAYLLHACPALRTILDQGPASVPPTAVHACIQRLSTTFHTLVTYQPAARFWPFQWAETGIFVAAALVLCAAACWWLRRRYG